VVPGCSNLSILVTHYRTPEAILHDCLTRLTTHCTEAEIIVLDANSQDGSEEMIRRDFPAVQFLTTTNHSFSNLVNTGLKRATRPYIAHMNADVMIEAHTFPDLLSVLAHPHVGMVGPRCRTPSGAWQDHGLPYRTLYARLARSHHPSLPAPWLSGCLQLLKREVVQTVGGLDASFRFYTEDMEWCWRIRKAGYECHLVRTDILHLGGSSTPNRASFIVEGYRGGFVLSQRYTSRFYQALHYLVVLAESGWKSRHAADPVRRDAYRRVYHMFRTRRFTESPFGATLQDDTHG
jgi:GT2 family glycosyltransferase